MLATLSGAITLSFPLNARGQDAATTDTTGKVWTLRKCLDYAIANNISLKQSRNTYLSGLEDTYEARSAMLPTVSASTVQGLTNRPFTSTSSTFTGAGAGISTSSGHTNYSGSYGLNTSMTLFEGGRLRNALKQKKVQNSIDSLSVAESMNDVRLAIVNAYMNILYARETVRLSESNAEVSEAQRDRAQEMKEAGTLSKVDLAQLESQHAGDLHEVTMAKTELEACKLQLKQLLELGIDEEIELRAPEIGEEKILQLLPSKSEVYANAVEAMPQIRRGTLDVASAELAVKQARAGYFPTLSATGSVGSTNISGVSTDFAQQIKNNLNESIGLSLSIPIVSGRRNKTAVNKAAIALENSKLQRANLEKELLKEVETAYLDVLSAQSRYLSAKEKEKYSKESYELTREQFDVGLKNTVELITAQGELFGARQAVAQAKYMALLNLGLLDIYQGTNILGI